VSIKFPEDKKQITVTGLGSLKTKKFSIPDFSKRILAKVNSLESVWSNRFENGSSKGGAVNGDLDSVKEESSILNPLS
jgi:hypothetical protein